MGFLDSSFSPPVWLARKSIPGKHFFFLLGHRMGPEVPQPNEARGARRAQLGQVRAPEKKNSSSKRAGSGPRVFARGSGPDMEKPDPLPFLGWISIGSIRSVFSCFQFLRTKEIRDNQKKKKKAYFSLLSHIFSASKHQTNKQKKNSKSCILLA